MRELLREIEVQCDPRQREYGVIHSTMATEAVAAPSAAAADEESEEEFDRCVCVCVCVRAFGRVPWTVELKKQSLLAREMTWSMLFWPSDAASARPRSATPSLNRSLRFEN